MNQKRKIEVERIISGSKVTVITELDANESIAPVVAEINVELDRIDADSETMKSASLIPQVSMGIVPQPNLSGEIPELATLSNPPHTYNASQAIFEIARPDNSKWSQQAHTVKELQARCVELGVRGVGNLQSFDAIVRALHGQGKLRREKVDGVYKYYAIGEKT